MEIKESRMTSTNVSDPDGNVVFSAQSQCNGYLEGNESMVFLINVKRLNDFVEDQTYMNDLLEFMKYSVTGVSESDEVTVSEMFTMSETEEGEPALYEESTDETESSSTDSTEDTSE